MNLLPFPGLSIQKRLPLLICILLLGVIVIFGYTSYTGVRGAAIASGKERAKALTSQVRTMFVQMGEVLIKQSQATAALPAMHRFINSGGKDSVQSVTAMLNQSRNDTLVRLAEVYNEKHVKLLASGNEKLNLPATDKTFWSDLYVNNAIVGVGKIFVSGAPHMYYPVTVEITEGKKVTGYFVKWRELVSTPQANEQFATLTGVNGLLHVGNDDGKFWTDGLKQIPSPPPGVNNNALDAITYVNEADKEVIESAALVPGTHWLVSVAVSTDIITKDAASFLSRLVIIGSVLVLTGFFIAWLVSRSFVSPLQKLTTAATAIAEGNYNVQVEINRKDELGKLAGAFNTMTSKRNSYEEELEASRTQLRELAAHLQNVREEERIGIAREIHDVLGQQLTAIRIDVSLLARKIAGDDTTTRQKAENILKLIDETIQITRRISSELRPDILETLGLTEALYWQSAAFMERTGIISSFFAAEEEFVLEKTVSFNLYRIYQEALTNIARHAGATEVKATLLHNENEVILTISDNGKGFNMEDVKKKKRLGIVGMKERVLSINGECTVDTAEGKGVTITVTVPLTASAAKKIMYAYK